MPLASGTRLGPYEIVALLGAGGMGEVYRARDTRLDRTVAIKILPTHLAHEPKSRQRFEREARAISALSHAHICALYDVGNQDGVDFVVMEFLEGETLATRLAKSALSTEELLAIASQIADALAQAHHHGIAHRDLKPGNIMLTKAGAKLLDFGLAKIVTIESGEAAYDATMTNALTAAGRVFGTLAYMSPEQLRGGEADARSDIFSFGAVLFEMATGQRAFPGNARSGVIAAILETDPEPVTALQPDRPAALDHLVQRCLAKDRDLRWESAHDLSLELNWIREMRSSPTRPTPTEGKRWWYLAAGVLLGGTMGAGAAALRHFTHVAQPEMSARFTITLPPNHSIREYASSSVALSPDGRLLAYAANRTDGSGIYLRRLDSLTSQLLPGTDQGRSPFFSSDGRWLGFDANSTLMKVSLDGGSPKAVCDTPFFVGASWAPDDTIIFVPVWSAGIWKVSANGGKPLRLTIPDHETAHAWPEVLPGGKWVLFTIIPSGAYDDSMIAVLSLETGERRVLIQGGFEARYAPGGYLVFYHRGNLMAARFDLERMKVTSPAVPVVEGVIHDPAQGDASFAVSRTGSLVYVPAGLGLSSRTLAWVDRHGHAQPVTEIKRAYSSPRISPDGRRIALWLEDNVANVWVYELQRGTLTRLTFGRDDHSNVWSPDGSRVAFESSRTGVHQIYVKRADGTGDEEQITQGSYEHYLGDWSPDGSHLVYTEYHPETGADLWVADLTGEHQARTFVRTPFAEKAAVFSPDGRWIAYVSNESGRDEVYIRHFEGSGERFQISTEGGEEPAWAGSGRELFYRNGGQMMVAPMTTKPDFQSGKPTPLFSGRYYYNLLPSRAYDIAGDGRFLMVQERDFKTAPTQVNVVVGWTAELDRHVPQR